MSPFNNQNPPAKYFRQAREKKDGRFFYILISKFCNCTRKTVSIRPVPGNTHRVKCDVCNRVLVTGTGFNGYHITMDDLETIGFAAMTKKIKIPGEGQRGVNQSIRDDCEKLRSTGQKLHAKVNGERKKITIEVGRKGRVNKGKYIPGAKIVKEILTNFMRGIQ